MLTSLTHTWEGSTHAAKPMHAWSVERRATGDLGQSIRFVHVNAHAPHAWATFKSSGALGAGNPFQMSTQCTMHIPKQQASNRERQLARQAMRHTPLPPFPVVSYAPLDSLQKHAQHFRHRHEAGDALHAQRAQNRRRVGARQVGHADARC